MAQRILRPAGYHWLNFRQSMLISSALRCCLATSCVQRTFLEKTLQPILQSPSGFIIQNHYSHSYCTEVDRPRSWTDISFTQLMSGINSNQIQLFDVRSREEVEESGMMPGSTNIPLPEIAEALELEEDEFRSRYGVAKPKRGNWNIVVSCLAGCRSRQALSELYAQGYYLARHFEGGWEEYCNLQCNDDLDALKPWTDLNYNELMSLIQSKDIQLFDVRSHEEVEKTGMIPGATNIPIGELEDAFHLSPSDFRDKYGVTMPLKEDNNVIVHCLAGFRSLGALAMLGEAGFHKARHFPGGWNEYSTIKNSSEV